MYKLVISGYDNNTFLLTGEEFNGVKQILDALHLSYTVSGYIEKVCLD